MRGPHGRISWNGDINTAQAQVKAVLDKLRKGDMPATDWIDPVTYSAGIDDQGNAFLVFDSEL